MVIVSVYVSLFTKLKKKTFTNQFADNKQMKRKKSHELLCFNASMCDITNQEEHIFIDLVRYVAL